MIDRRRLLLLGPLGAVAVAGVGFWAVLDRMGQGTFDPHLVESPLLNRPIPEFKLPGLNGPGFGTADIKAQGKPLLINFFASWCLPCLAEHPDLTSLAGEGVPIWAVAYKDKEAAASRFLSEHGNPYARIAQDQDGLTAINWGVYGVPESYLIDKEGIIRRKFVGPITPDIADKEIRPLMRRLA